MDGFDQRKRVIMIKQNLLKTKHIVGNIYSSIHREVQYILGKEMRGDYQIAFRKIKAGGLLMDEVGEFQMIPNLRQGFAADPFLFEYKGTLYLFAEIMNQKKGVGEIGYCKWTGKKFSKWKVIIRENYHLSYPLVFLNNNDIYIIPEAKSSHSLYLYKAKVFPNVWEKLNPIIDGCDLCDTTLFTWHGEKYAFTTSCDEQGNHLQLLTFDNSLENIVSYKRLSDDKSISRCGGQVIQDNGNLIRVAQDCSKVYGEKLIFLLFSIKDGGFDEEIYKVISANEIKKNKQMKVSRIHTYNVCNDVEVIDLF
jgi:hypothetical protein